MMSNSTNQGLDIMKDQTMYEQQREYAKIKRRNINEDEIERN